MILYAIDMISVKTVLQLAKRSLTCHPAAVQQQSPPQLSMISYATDMMSVKTVLELAKRSLT
jgi:hypothetical protein